MVNVYVNGEYVGTDDSVVGHMMKAVSDPSMWTVTLTKNEKIIGQYALEPCPFCGGEATLNFFDDNDPPCHWKAVRPECTKCSAHTKTHFLNGPYEENNPIGSAIFDWNRRA